MEAIARFGVAMVILQHFFVHKAIATCGTYSCTCAWAAGWPAEKTTVSFNDEIIINMREIIACATRSPLLSPPLFLTPSLSFKYNVVSVHPTRTATFLRRSFCLPSCILFHYSVLQLGYSYFGCFFRILFVSMRVFVYFPVFSVIKTRL